MISSSRKLTLVVHDTRNVPYSAWGRKARREGGGLYYHARGTSPDRACLGSHALFRSVPTPPPIRDGAALSPTKCPRLVALSCGTSRGPRKSLCQSECEFAPVPPWLMGINTKVQAAEYTSSKSCPNSHSLIRSSMGAPKKVPEASNASRGHFLG